MNHDMSRARMGWFKYSSPTKLKLAALAVVLAASWQSIPAQSATLDGATVPLAPRGAGIWAASAPATTRPVIAKVKDVARNWTEVTRQLSRAVPPPPPPAQTPDEVWLTLGDSTIASIQLIPHHAGHAQSFGFDDASNTWVAAAWSQHWLTDVMRQYSASNRSRTVGVLLGGYPATSLLEYWDPGDPAKD